MKLALTSPQGISTVKKGLVLTKNFIVKQSPIILSVTAVTGVCTTTVLAVKGGIKANELIKEAENAKQKTSEEGLTFQEKVQTSWKAFVPCGVSAFLTISAIVGSTAISQKRTAALAGLYALSETALKEYQEKIEKELGPKQAQHITDEINADKVRNQSPPQNLSELPAGKVLVYDKLSGRYFMSAVETLRRGANDLNHAILGGDMCASLNDFYSLIGLDCISLGEECGWNLDTMCELYFTSTLTSDMKPCLVMDFANGHEPSYRYRDI